mmetsp:Transcript_15059/g.42832  ORF Transcript_15059/g.42832 Transcript_15059/m.42832 type:complete len:233 (+) Transcript_15059:557-1255(+)
MDVEACRRDGHSCRELQMVRVVSVHLAGRAGQLDVLVDGARTLGDVPPKHVALRRAFLADVSGQRLLQSQVCPLRTAGVPPGPRGARVCLLAWVAAPEAGGEGEQHAERDLRAGVLRVAGPPSQILGNRVVQGLDGAIVHQSCEHHCGGPLAGAARGDLRVHLEMAAFVQEQPAVLRGADRDCVVLRELPLLEELAQGVPLLGGRWGARWSRLADRLGRGNVADGAAKPSHP